MEGAFQWTDHFSDAGLSRLEDLVAGVLGNNRMRTSAQRLNADVEKTALRFVTGTEPKSVKPSKN